MPSFARSLALAASLIVAGASPGVIASRVVAESSLAAASPATRAFLANLVPNVDFLDRSSRFALTNSKSARLHAFALNEAREQTTTADALYDWATGAAHPIAAAARAPGTDLDRTPTGSTKPAWPKMIFSPGLDAGSGAKPDDRVPRGQEDLDSMEGLEGKAFDAQYKDTQRDALEQVEADYRDYLVKGDDLALLALARRELPKIAKRRTALAKI